MRVFSLGRSAIFTTETKVPLQIGGFPDFYALLSMPRDASPVQLETAITSRAADLLAASFSRGGKGELITLLNRHIADFRPTLLDPAARESYDSQLQLHESSDIGAQSFEKWQQTFSGQSRLSRGLKSASNGFKSHLKSVLWDSEFI